MLETGFALSRYIVKLSSRHRTSGCLEPAGKAGLRGVCEGACTAVATMLHIGHPDFGAKSIGKGRGEGVDSGRQQACLWWRRENRRCVVMRRDGEGERQEEVDQEQPPIRSFVSEQDIPDPSASYGNLPKSVSKSNLSHTGSQISLPSRHFFFLSHSLVPDHQLMIGP